MTTARMHRVADSSGMRADAPPWSVLARHEDRFSSVEIVEYRLDDQMRVVINPDDLMVEMLLHDQPVHRFAQIDRVPGKHTVGNTAFFFLKNRLTLEWKEPMAVRAVRCHFNRTPKGRTFTQDELIIGMTLSSPILARHLNRMVSELCNPGFESRVLLECLGRQIAVELGRFFRRSAAAETLKLSEAQMAAVNRCIEEDGPWPTTETLAEACYVSKRHFFRLFRRTTNLSPADYVMFYRIERAKRLLREDKLIIKQVAYSCGFSSASAFSTAFRRATGSSPRDFQRVERLD